MDVVNSVLYFVSKTSKTLFALDLDKGTYSSSSTESGAFDLQPDQLKSIGSSDGPTDQSILYFCEDGGSQCDVHGRNLENGKFFTIIEGTGYSTETTGLAFSPIDAKYMFLAFQGPGVIWKFWRTDGLSFAGTLADIKYPDQESAIDRRLYFPIP
mmetsp:Transcript_29038/g.79702  ORF Transcript_29038/g.79702 Transcript_29038/m.79702 type:complete len:155 (+) Transcript_29038:1016-1480(+)